MQSYLIFTWEFANSSESIRVFSHQVISRFDALGLRYSCYRWFSCSFSLSGCCACQASVGLSGLDSTVHLLRPQLTSHMLGDPRAQDQVYLQHTSMFGSHVVGLQECLVARGWVHRGFHTKELETHCRQLAWFNRVQTNGQAIWAGLFWMQLLEQTEG